MKIFVNAILVIVIAIWSAAEASAQGFHASLWIDPSVIDLTERNKFEALRKLIIEAAYFGRWQSAATDFEIRRDSKAAIRLAS